MQSVPYVSRMQTLVREMDGASYLAVTPSTGLASVSSFSAPGNIGVPCAGPSLIVLLQHMTETFGDLDQVQAAILTGLVSEACRAISCELCGLPSCVHW